MVAIIRQKQKQITQLEALKEDIYIRKVDQIEIYTMHKS